MSAKTTRLYYLDWLRVIAIFLVFVYHSLRFFNLEDWNVKNATIYPALQPITDFFDIWGMPLMFVISGAAVCLSLRQGKAVKFIRDRVLRLLVPLLVDIFTQSIVQVYLERIMHNQFSGSFFDFLPHYFDGFYGFGGNFVWFGFHLWYLEILFIFSIICLPLFLWLTSNFGARILSKLGDLLALPGGIYLLIVPLVLIWNLQDRDSILGMDAFGWSLAAYLAFLLSGFVLIAHERAMANIERLRWVSLLGAVALTAVWLATKAHEDFVVWFWILAMLGFGKKYLNVGMPILAYVGEMMLPFYIMHQAVLQVVGYFIVQWAIPDPLKYIIITTSSFAVIVLVYEYLVRRYNVLRFLFGMRLIAKTFTAPQLSVASSASKEKF